MGVAYEERAAGVLTTSLVAEGTSSRVTVGSTTNVAHILSTNDDDAVLVLTGTPGSGNALGALGKNDSLWTNGGTPMTFVNAGQNTNDNIEASAPALQTFHDVIESFKDGDH